MSLTVYKELEQGSQEWLDARRGLVTASTIGRLITVGIVGADGYGCPDCGAEVGDPCISKASKTPKPITTHHGARSAIAVEVGAQSLSVADNDTSRALLRTLAAERISGHVEETFTTFAMQRGTDDEPFARDAYAEWAGVEVEEVGFMVREEDGVKLGFSPDGLVNCPVEILSGAIECKSRNQPRQLETILDDQVPTENLPQMHAGMWVSGRQFCDYISYRDGLHLYVKRVHRDPAWDAVISEAAYYAEKTITEYVATYTKRVEGLPFIEKRPDLDDIQIGA